MNQAKNVKVSIFGERYSFVSDEPEARVIEAAQRIDTLIREITGKAAHSDLKKVAVLIAVQAMSKQLALEATLETKDAELKQLIEMVDREMLNIISGRS